MPCVRQNQSVQQQHQLAIVSEFKHNSLQGTSLNPSINPNTIQMESNCHTNQHPVVVAETKMHETDTQLAQVNTAGTSMSCDQLSSEFFSDQNNSNQRKLVLSVIIN